MLLTMVRGDSFEQEFELLSNGLPLDLGTLALIRFTAKRSRADLDSAALIRLSTGVGGVTILDQTTDPPEGTKGRFTVSLTPAETLALAVDEELYWDIQATLRDGRVQTPLRGKLFIEGDVTLNSGDVGTDT